MNPPASYTLHGYVGNGVVSASDLLTNNPLAPTRSTNDPFVIDVTSFIQQRVANGDRYAGFTFTGFPGGSGLEIRSSEPFVNSPLLTVQAVLEPITVLPIALIALLRRHRSSCSSA
jgi:hypothetical protein